MTKSIPFIEIKNGEYIYHTENGTQAISDEPIKDIELEQLENYLRENHPEERCIN